MYTQQHSKSFIHSSSHPINHPSIYPSIHSFIYPSNHPSSHPINHPIIYPFIRLSIQASNHSFIHPINHSSIHWHINSVIHQSTFLQSIHSSIKTLICLLSNNHQSLIHYINHKSSFQIQISTPTYITVLKYSHFHIQKYNVSTCITTNIST